MGSKGFGPSIFTGPDSHSPRDDGATHDTGEEVNKMMEAFFYAIVPPDYPNFIFQNLRPLDAIVGGAVALTVFYRISKNPYLIVFLSVLAMIVSRGVLL